MQLRWAPAAAEDLSRIVAGRRRCVSVHNELGGNIHHGEEAYD